MLDPKLLEIICCPVTKADLVYFENSLISTDKETRYKYRIEEDIPVLLSDEAEQLSVEEWEKVMQNSKSVK
jgi:uncharacterized protein YbaR (Trm112 family)